MTPSSPKKLRSTPAPPYDVRRRQAHTCHNSSASPIPRTCPLIPTNRIATYVGARTGHRPPSYFPSTVLSDTSSLPLCRPRLLCGRENGGVVERLLVAYRGLLQLAFLALPFFRASNAADTMRPQRDELQSLLRRELNRPCQRLEIAGPSRKDRQRFGRTRTQERRVRIAPRIEPPCNIEAHRRETTT